jgi:hypothetical protein
VHFICCDQAGRSQSQPSDDLYISTMTEPTVCSYNMTICFSQMCAPPPGAGEARQASENLALGPIVQALVSKNVCMQLQASWWTYEICFARGIEQFHPTTKLTNVQGGAESKVVEVGGYDSCLSYTMHCITYVSCLSVSL